MDYTSLYSDAVRRSKASAIRELLKVIAQPDIISFAGGLPSPDLFPAQEIAARSEERRVGKECISRWSPYH